jgi:hypothetical protein
MKRTVALGVAVVAAVVGCGGAEVGLVGVSPPRAVEPALAVLDAGAKEAPVPADFRARLSRVSDRFLSRGHAGRFDGVVWASEEAAVAAASGGDFADGARFVEEAFGRDGVDGGAAGLLAMERRKGIWHFAAVGPDGDVAGDARTGACVACHREAPHDFVFATPAPSAVAPAATPGDAGPAATPSSTAPAASPSAGAPTAAPDAGSTRGVAAPAQSSSAAARAATTASAPTPVTTPATR